jgi:hypothetical protein
MNRVQVTADRLIQMLVESLKNVALETSSLRTVGNIPCARHIQLSKSASFPQEPNPYGLSSSYTTSCLLVETAHFLIPYKEIYRSHKKRQH